MQYIKISQIHGADYNPRYLSPEAFELLKESLLNLGCIKPVLVNKANRTIIAGHQRTKALEAIGMDEAPAVYITGITKTDEVRFNQFHNASDRELDEKQPRIRLKTILHPGWNTVSPKDCQVISIGELGEQVKSVSNLILKYGAWGAAVANDSDIIISSVYALGCINLGKSFEVFHLPAQKAQLAKHYFSQDYGVFSYDHIEKKTYVQTLAQMQRLRNNDGEGKDNNSNLYKRLVIPYLVKNKSARVLDFGAGQKDYARMLNKKGYNITALEPYHRKKGENVIDYRQVCQDYETVISQVKHGQLYDVVVCDSVLNSVDSLEAERSVLLSISALCKPGGVVFWSGIPREYWEYKQALKNTNTNNKSELKFIDKHGFHANFRAGNWFFQKYHYLDEVFRLNNDLIGKVHEVYNQTDKPVKPGNNFRGSSFQVKVINTHGLPTAEYLKALEFEFSLVLPNGKRYPYAEAITAAYTVNQNG
jgi:ParB family transcriptional regulator, chromosome partitioning protein